MAPALTAMPAPQAPPPPPVFWSPQKYPPPYFPPPPVRRHSVAGRVVALVVVLLLGLLAAATYVTHDPIQSTITLNAGYMKGVGRTLPAGTVITGQFQEMGGSPVSFFVLSDAQWTSWKNGVDSGDLYATLNVPSGSFRFTTPVDDTFHLIFDHGDGLGNMTENVFFSRDYAIPHLSNAVFAAICFGGAGILAVMVVRERRRAKATPPAPAFLLPPP